MRCVAIRAADGARMWAPRSRTPREPQASLSCARERRRPRPAGSGFAGLVEQPGRPVTPPSAHRLAAFSPRRRSRILSVPRALVAQLDRASVYETEGRRFESCRAHHDPSPHLREPPPGPSARRAPNPAPSSGGASLHHDPVGARLVPGYPGTPRTCRPASRRRTRLHCRRGAPWARGWPQCTWSVRLPWRSICAAPRNAMVRSLRLAMMEKLPMRPEFSEAWRSTRRRTA